ncbi:hypothetical protein GOC49_06140 [Sinorhizobium meliloti]|nr:hypothetical protein [Sinorhizobium meliloti]MDX0298290.1 hypothetical protein [Sinorhizobium meliloti]MDX0330411.1 hypothetical protein [Sinorhizobium meliloti]MDX0383126.1 hypothetical protein [Sinorhizobium meliloti]
MILGRIAGLLCFGKQKPLLFSSPNMSSRATGRVSRAIMVSWLVLVIKADELDRPAWTLRRGLPMENFSLNKRRGPALGF